MQIFANRAGHEISEWNFETSVSITLNYDYDVSRWKTDSFSNEVETRMESFEERYQKINFWQRRTAFNWDKSPD